MMVGEQAEYPQNSRRGTDRVCRPWSAAYLSNGDRLFDKMDNWQYPIRSLLLSSYLNAGR